MMWVLLFFSSSVLGDSFDDHLSKYINASIPPCHDFYAHVCPYPMRTSDAFLESLAGRNVLQKVRPYLDKEMQAVLRDVEVDHTGDQTFDRNENDTKRFIKERCEKDPQTKFYLNSVQGAMAWLVTDVHSSEDTNCSMLSEFYSRFSSEGPSFFEVSRDMNRQIEATAFITYMEKDEADFQKHFQKAVDIFNKLRNHILMEAKRTPWIEAILPNVTRTLETIRLIRPNPLTRGYHWMKEKEKYKKCYSALSGLTNHDARMCAIASFYRILGQYVINSFNAIYNAWDNTVELMPALLFSDLKENTQKILLTFVIAHEIAHSIYKKRQIQPKNAACLEANMREACNLFDKGFECGSANETYHEDVADWVAMQAVQFLYQNHTEAFPNFTPRQSIFYILIIMGCTNQRGRGDDSHSIIAVRLNGLLRQFKEFQDEFKCSNEDQMVAKKRCFLLGENATKKNPIFRE